jgi:SAM-dependent methyltransferase
MPSADHHDELWRSLPRGLPPAHRRLRERFLRERYRDLAGELDRPLATGPSRPPLGRAPRVLDLGCGEGHFAGLLDEEGAEVVAVEVAPEAVRRAQAAHPGLDVRLVAPGERLPFEDSLFDLVWAGEVIEHVAYTQAWLSEVRRVLRSGGVLLLSTPDHGPLSILAMAVRPRRFDACFDPRSDHLRFYTRRSLALLLGDFGFCEVTVRGAGGVPGARAVLLAYARRARF